MNHRMRLCVQMVRVYLFRGKHPLYETFTSYPPNGVDYLPHVKSGGAEEYKLYRPSHNIIRRASDASFAVFGLPRMVPVFRRYDVVHSSRGFIPIGPNRFVVDVEHASSFVGMDHDRLRSSRTRRIVTGLLASAKCCRVLPHCEAAMRTLSLLSDEKGLMDKATVLYPAIDGALFGAPRTSEDPPHLLFMGEYFWKGGRELLEACRQLRNKLDFRLTYISLRVHPPQHVIQKARDEIQMQYFEGPVARRELINEIYPSVDVFAMPTYIDTFGYAFLEAMACGIPCVGTRHFAVPEIIQHEVTGFIVNPPMTFFDGRGLGHPEMSPEGFDNSQTISELKDCLSRLIESRSLRERMGARGKAEVVEGKFSIAARNAILSEVYGSCMQR